MVGAENALIEKVLKAGKAFAVDLLTIACRCSLFTRLVGVLHGCALPPR